MLVYDRFIKTLFFVVVFALNGQSQNFDLISIPFEVEGAELQNPLIGGLIAPQFVSFDLDGKGAEDLVVFDRNGDVLIPFINLSTPGNPNYMHAPEYSSSFPELNNFVKFIDFNNDGKKDIFTLSMKALGIEVWRNSSEGDNISFELMKFDTGFGDVIPINVGNGLSNIYLPYNDIPSIIDIDNDGDLDILVSDVFNIYLYTNMVKEMGLSDDTLAYDLTDRCWGNFFKNYLSGTVSLSNDRSKCASYLKGKGKASTMRHETSAGITLLDNDGDGDLDMLLGQAPGNGLIFLENDEQDDDAFIIKQDSIFPSYNEKAEIYSFLGSFYIDIDNDGKRDLIVCPSAELNSDNNDHIWYYNNVGEDNAPIFELVQKDFLYETTLRMGHSSHPCFLDYNEDGLTDLLVGMNHTITGGNSVSISLYLYENIGTKSSPRFQLVDDNYLDLKDGLTHFNGYLAPAVGDLDGDGDTDIIVADNRTHLFYFENKAGPNSPYQFDDFIYEYQNIRVGTNGKPAIIDLDEDGLNDIVLGERNDNVNFQTGDLGGVNFFKNIGSIGSPDFMEEETVFPNTDKLGRIYTKSSTSISGSSAPFFFEGEDGLMVAVGSKHGAIYVYDNILGNLYDSFNLLYEDLPVLPSGNRTSVAVADIDDDGYHEMIVGNDRGGLMAFNTIFATGEMVSTKEEGPLTFHIQPNPTNDFIRVDFEGIEGHVYSISNMDGRVVVRGKGGELKNGFDISFLPVGLYALSVESENGIAVEKFVKY